MHSRLLALALTGATGLIVLTPVAAFAAPHTRPSHAPVAHPRPAHGQPAHKEAPDRLRGPRKAALHALAADTAQVTQIAAAEQAAASPGLRNNGTVVSGENDLGRVYGL